MELPCCLIPSRPVDPLDGLLLVGDLATYTWGSALARMNYFATPPPDGVRRAAQNGMAVRLLHQVGRASPFDLVRESQSSDLVLDAARRLVSGESLAQAANTLLERMTRLPSEAAEAAFALMNLWGDSLFQVDRRIMPKSLQAKLAYMRGLLTSDELCHRVYEEARGLLFIITKALRTYTRDRVGVPIRSYFSELGLGLYPNNTTPAGLWQGVPLYELAWRYGYLPEMGLATHNRWPVPTYSLISICRPDIELAACRIVFLGAAQRQPPVIAAALGRLAERAGASPAEQLGCVRAALTDMVLWHEIGHVWSQQWIGKAASGPAYRDSYPDRWTTVREFYAECRSARQILGAGDPLARDVFLLLHLGDVEPEEKLRPQLPSYRWPIVRALIGQDGLRYLSSWERTLRRMLGGMPLKSIDEWFERQAEEAVADVGSELVG